MERITRFKKKVGPVDIDLIISTREPFVSIPKPEKLKYPEGLVESLIPLVQEIAPPKHDNGDDDAYWTKLQKDAPMSPEQARELIRRKRINKSKLADVVLHRLYHREIETGEISSDYFDSLKTSLVTVFSEQPKTVISSRRKRK